MEKRKIAAPLVLNPEGEFWKNCLLTVDSKGSIVEIAPDQENIDSLEMVEYYNGILIPGMVNAHCHLELSYLLGQVSQGKGLVEFIREIMSVRNDFTFECQQDKAIVEDRKMWSEGVQGCLDISNGEASFEAKRSSNLLYHTYAEYFNMPSDDKVDSYYAASTAHMAKARALGLKISQTPHSNYMVGDKLFKKSADSEACSIHFMETPSEVDYFEKSGKMYDFVTSDNMVPDFLHYGGHAERLIGSLPKDMPLLLVHNTMITEQQVDMLSSYFTNLTFVLCPLSNYFIERSFPPAEMLMRKGVNVALGTDSLTSNHSLTMALELDWLLRNNADLPLGVALKWATLGGAIGLRAEQKIGSFEVGKECGVVLLEGVDTKSMRPSEDTKLSSRRLI